MNIFRTVIPSILVALLVSVAMLVSGCGEGNDNYTPGAMTLSWEAGPAASCEAAEIVEVELQLLRGGDDLEDRLRFDCDEGSAWLEHVRPGRYDLVVTGLDADGRSTFIGEKQSVRVEEGQQVDAGTVTLTARPATVELAWYFDNGRLCTQNDIETVEVVVYDEEYYYLHSRRFDCNEGFGTTEEVPAGSYVLEVVGLNADDHVKARAVVPIEVERGDQVMVDVSLGLK